MRSCPYSLSISSPIITLSILRDLGATLPGYDTWTNHPHRNPIPASLLVTLPPVVHCIRRPSKSDVLNGTLSNSLLYKPSCSWFGIAVPNSDTVPIEWHSSDALCSTNSLYSDCKDDTSVSSFSRRCFARDSRAVESDSSVDRSFISSFLYSFLSSKAFISTDIRSLVMAKCCSWSCKWTMLWSWTAIRRPLARFSSSVSFACDTKKWQDHKIIQPK